MEQIEKLIAGDQWESARKIIRKELAREPNDHWLLTRLSLTYYEQRRYRTALLYSEKSLKLAPRCPLVLWDYAGTLDMLCREAEALAVYQSLVRRGARRIAEGECGEGIRRARSLIADCWYRMASCQIALGDPPAAVRAIRRHISMRGPGVESIYSVKEARERLVKYSSLRNDA